MCYTLAFMHPCLCEFHIKFTKTEQSISNRFICDTCCFSQQEALQHGRLYKTNKNKLNTFTSRFYIKMKLKWTQIFTSCFIKTSVKDLFWPAGLEEANTSLTSMKRHQLPMMLFFTHPPCRSIQVNYL